MILSVSRRTDIPAFYSDWFFNRIKEGFVYVRNPMNIHQVSKIRIEPEVVDCIVFWTKNPSKMLDRLSELDSYHYYFQFTVNPYNHEIESNVPRKTKIFETFKRLSDKLGPKRIIWRYDPILISPSIDINYHKQYFEVIAKELSDYTKTAVISFIDNYKKTQRNLKPTLARELQTSEVKDVANKLSEIAKAFNLNIQTCAEEYDLEEFGIEHGKCIDDKVIENIIGKRIEVGKDKNQRKECGCVESIDIGEYNTCKHNCLYCYANYSSSVVDKKICEHDPSSPFLIGILEEKDKIFERKLKSLIKEDTLF